MPEFSTGQTDELHKPSQYKQFYPISAAGNNTALI